MAYAQESGSEGSGLSTILWVVGAVGLWKMFEKAGEAGWAGIIPFYREYKLCEKVMNDPWYWLREFVVIIPIIGWIGYIYFKYQIGKATAAAYGKPQGWAWGYTFLEPVFYCITGFDNSDYYGPYGAGDRRTGAARQARTVDFDVVRNEPETRSYNAQPEVKSYQAQPEIKINQVDDDVVVNGVRDVEFDTTDNGAKAGDVEFSFDQDGNAE